MSSMTTCRLSTAFLAAALSALGATAAYSAEPVFPPGSRIGLVPPADMVPARGMSGFQNPKTGAAIMAVEMAPEAYPSLSASFTDEALKAQGFTLKSRETTKVGVGEGTLMVGEQTDGVRTVGKSILITADPTLTALVIAQTPPGAPPALSEEMRAALMTVAIRPPLSSADQLAALPFRMRDDAGFRVVRAMAGNAILMTDGPKDVVREAEQPILIVAQSMGGSPAVADRETFARSALISNTVLTETVIERSQAFRQDGADWHEIVAKAKDGISQKPVIVMQTIRFERDGYLRVVGIVGAELRDAVLPRFRRVADGVVQR